MVEQYSKSLIFQQCSLAGGKSDVSHSREALISIQFMVENFGKRESNSIACDGDKVDEAFRDGCNALHSFLGRCRGD